MALIDPTTKEYPQATEYFHFVSRVLQDVFGMNGQRAGNLIGQLQQSMAHRSPEERLLFFHREPLDLASDLMGKSPTEQDVHLYREIARKMWWHP